MGERRLPPEVAAGVVSGLLAATGIAPRFELVAVAVALVLAVGGGAMFGWHRTRRRRGAAAGAGAALTLTMAMAGPVPVGRSTRAFGIFLAVLPAACVGGMVVAVAAAQIFRRGDSRRKMVDDAHRG